MGRTVHLRLYRTIVGLGWRVKRLSRSTFRSLGRGGEGTGARGTTGPRGRTLREDDLVSVAAGSHIGMKRLCILRDVRFPEAANATAMADIQPADPENDVFGNIGSVIGDALKMARGQDELHARADRARFTGHALELPLKNAIAVLI